jgi:hypothetical protein
MVGRGSETGIYKGSNLIFSVLVSPCQLHIRFIT